MHFCYAGGSSRGLEIVLFANVNIHSCTQLSGMQGINISLWFRLDEILVSETLTGFCAQQKPKNFSMGACASRDSPPQKGKCRGVLVYKVSLKMYGTLRGKRQRVYFIGRVTVFVSNKEYCKMLQCAAWRMNEKEFERSCSLQLKRVIMWLINNSFPHYSVSEVER